MRIDTLPIPILLSLNMVVALTYDLKQRYLKEGYTPEEAAEFDSIETIEAIERALQELGFKTEAVGNIFDLVDALSCGKRWPLVFNIAEGVHGLCREAQIPALLDAYKIPYVFSDSLTMVMTLHKGLAKERVKEWGVPTASWISLSSPEEIERVTLPYPLFVKPVGGGTGVGIDDSSIIENRADLKRRVTHLLKEFHQPVLVETYLTGREFTVGIVGTKEEAKVVGAMEIVVSSSSDSGIYSYQSKREYLKQVRYRQVNSPLFEECETVALGAWRALECRDGGRVDLKMDEKGDLNFLEVNPLAGLHPIDSDLPILARMRGIDYTTLIALIMKSACSRLGINHEF